MYLYLKSDFYKLVFVYRILSEFIYCEFLLGHVDYAQQ